MMKLKICIDPGHGGRDPGAVGQGGLKEKDVVLKIALKLGRLLTKQNIDVDFTRTTDIALGNTLDDDLNLRSNIANKIKADYFISIHCNSSSNPGARGIETYALAPGGHAEKLARAVQRRLVIETGREDRGVKFANYAVLRKTNMPAILIEVCFISNFEEEIRLKDDAFLDRVANAIAGGVFDFLGIQYEGEVIKVIDNVKDALNKLVEKGVINSPDYWLKAVDVVKHLDVLLINMANKLQ